jgi:hypothetical protein
MKLPGGDRAIVPWEKLIDYSLNPNHGEGGNKARVFRAALGITRENAGVLREALLRAAADGEAIESGSDEYGRRFRIRFQLETPAGQATIISAWIIDTGSSTPRLVSCFVDDEGGSP